MKLDQLDEIPLRRRRLRFEGCPEMLQAPFREMIGTPLLAEPAGALAGKDIGAVRVAAVGMGGAGTQILPERAACGIGQIQGAGFPAFRVEQGDRAGALIDLALIPTQGSDFADS